MAVLLGVLGAAAGYLVLGSSAFAVRTVAVVGVGAGPAAQVRAAAAVPPGTPLARVDAGRVAARVLRALPTVDTVSVQRAWPSTLRLVVRERQLAGVASTGGRYLLLDRDGVAYGQVARPPEGTPLLVLAHPGPADPATRAALTVAAALPADLRRQVSAIVAPSAADLTLRLSGGRSAFWGDASASPRKAAALRVLLRRPGTVFDVSSPQLVTARS